ncbi:3-oxo-tetronate kinase [Neorhizobium galegae]|uniref:3-oxo-tetronate kinase n=1 Tax=Neorhizobium galegae bv. orientalis str. HAMBI 540 TaxID=1028800 RepID=A0A068T0B1_NEOGA|nr:3-oxo-tetronate kinase [Neorhizobium galegae]MCQ1854191.1 four-carbon acid sugar kinase family protein [Neorhizobium galegae]CDN51843.1 HopAN1 protein [Neorhizobium galegae bv. orientalis str. HAMBI 540]CDZ51761.1 YgbK domain protein [Neorhizobium galegae bv. orientalis]
MLLGVIADDFTGASDIANTLAKGLAGQGGLAVTQYLGIPTSPAAPDVEAAVISLKTRSAPVEAAVVQSLAALEWLQAQGCVQFVFKYCSTFDSTPEGNIGPVSEALANALGVKGVIACPAFPTVGRTVHQGHLFVHDQLLSESSMRHHPLTPMTDSDIRRWLTHQTRDLVGLVPVATVRAGSAEVRAALDAAAAEGRTMVICDAAIDQDLITLGAAAAGVPFLTGGSGIAIGLPANFIRSGLARGARTSFEGVAGPEAILAGSCSAATRHQIATHANDHPVMALDVDAIMAGTLGVREIVEFVASHRGQAPLVYSSDDPMEVEALQSRYGRESLALTLDGLFADTARALVDSGVTRLVVAGGETSGAVAQALDLEALSIGPEIDPGVPILAEPTRAIALALKSGNFGAPDFFRKALRLLEGGVSL